MMRELNLNESNESVNMFELSGRIVSAIESKDNITVTLYVKGKNGGKDIFPKVIVSRSNWNNYKNHERVYVKGYISTMVRMMDGKKIYLHRYIATEIKKEVTIVEKVFGNGVKGKFFEGPYAVAYVSGRIVSARKDNDYYRYVVKSKNPKTGNDNTLNISMRSTERHPNYEIGDLAYFICNITTKKESSGRYFIDLMATDISEKK